MRPRGFTLLEVMVASGVLLVMVTMTSMATISYLRAYRHYTNEGLKLRQTAKTLEALCLQLRSARALQSPLPTSLRQAPLQFEKRNHEGYSLQIVQDRLVVIHDKESVSLGVASDVNFDLQKDLLHISLPVAGQQPVHTAISLRGVRR